MMKKLFVSGLLLVSLLATTTMLFASGQQAQSGQAEGSKQVKITWWALSGGGGADDPRENIRKQIIADFEKANPNVKIDLVMLENEAFKQKVQVAVQAGTPPDLFHSWGGGVMVEYAKAGALKDITSFVQSELTSTIGKGALEVYGYEGKFYGAPYDMGAVGLWYNKDAFAKAGVSVPKTWDDLLAAVPKLKAAGYVPIALGAGDRWPAHFWWVYLAMRLGGKDAFDKAYSGKVSFKDEPFVKAGELLLQLKNLEPFQTGYLGATYDNQAAVMGNGQAAMELMGQWAQDVQVANSSNGKGIGDALAWAPFPAVAGGKGQLTDAMGGGGGYVVGKNAPKETLDFLKFFLQRQYNEALVKIEGTIPVVKGAEVALKERPNHMAIAQAVANAGYYQLYYDQYLPPSVGEAVKDAVVGLLAGKLTPAQCAAAIDDAWQKERTKK
ncbi:MAG: extracellular solute-binding protein [Spirochaetota bacterium]|jgi:raffinose/stachyose/melibiose transport system substrate-binding protein